MFKVFDYIFKMNEEEYSLQVDNMLYMLVNEGMVIDERTGEEVYIDAFTFTYHPTVTTLYTSQTSYDENFPPLCCC